MDIISENDVEDPVTAEDGVDDHGGIIPPYLLVSQLVPQESILGRRDAQACGLLAAIFISAREAQLTPVHDNIPDAAVDAVDGRAEYKERHHLCRPTDAI